METKSTTDIHIRRGTHTNSTMMHPEVLSQNRANILQQSRAPAQSGCRPQPVMSTYHVTTSNTTIKQSKVYGLFPTEPTKSCGGAKTTVTKIIEHKTPPINTLINTLMQQYQLPTSNFVDVKKSGLQNVNESFPHQWDCGDSRQCFEHVDRSFSLQPSRNKVRPQDHLPMSSHSQVDIGLNRNIKTSSTANGFRNGSSVETSYDCHTPKLWNTQPTTNQASRKEPQKVPATGTLPTRSIRKDVDVERVSYSKDDKHFFVQFPKRNVHVSAASNNMMDAFTDVTPSDSHRGMTSPDCMTETFTEITPSVSAREPNYMKDAFTETTPSASNAKETNYMRDAFTEITPSVQHKDLNYMKDAFTEITPSVSHREMGTQMTPSSRSSRMSSHRPSHSATSTRYNSTPTKEYTSISMNVSRMNPVQELDSFRDEVAFQRLSQTGKQMEQSISRSFNSNWSSREEEDEEVERGLKQVDVINLRQDLDPKSSAWLEATRFELLQRYDREETKIQAWEDQQVAKAEAELKKLEMRLEKKRIQAAEKIANKLEAARKKANELRISARARKLKAVEKSVGQQEGNKHPHPSHLFCACFTCAM